MNNTLATSHSGTPAHTQSLGATAATLSIEERREFEDLLAAFRLEHKPSGPTEDYLVRQLAFAYWKSGRNTRFDTGATEYQMEVAWHLLPAAQRRPMHPQTHDAVFDQGTRVLGRAFLMDSAADNSQTKLTRNQAMAERSFLRCLQQLMFIQACRNTAQAAEPSKPRALRSLPKVG